MQIELSPLVKKIRTSLMFHMLEKAKEMEGRGIDIIHLEKGEPELGPPKGAVEAAKKAMDEGHNILTPSPGIKELRDAIAADLFTEYGITVDPAKEIIVTPGGKFGIYASMASILQPGDEVLCLSPFFPSHREIVEMVGGVFVPVPLLHGQRCEVVIEKFEERMTPRTRALLLNYPHNPTGWVPTEQEIGLLRELVRKKGLVVVSDEVYDKITFGAKHQPFFGFDEIREQLILVNSFSKRFGMTGWRIGYCVAPSHVIGAMVRIQQNTTTCANSAVQKAATAALRHEQSYCQRLPKVYGDRKDFFIERVRQMRGLDPIQPKGSFYVFVSIAQLPLNSIRFAEDLLEEEHVAIAPGAAFGEEWDTYVRFSLTEDPEKIAIAVDRLKRFVERRI